MWSLVSLACLLTFATLIVAIDRSRLDKTHFDWDRFKTDRAERPRSSAHHYRGALAQKKTQQAIDDAKKDIEAYANAAASKIRTQAGTSADADKLVRVFKKTFMNTIDTTVRATPEGRVFVITGDIANMWLRDSVPQVEHYLECCAASSDSVRQMLVKLVNEHAFLALQDPYANAFNDPPEYGDTRSLFRRGGYVATGNYELDSFGYSTRLAYLLWRRTGTTEHFDEMFRAACRMMMVVWRKEQNHAATSTYRYNPAELRINGMENSASGHTGMTWSGFRPSDDPCTYHYNVPDNMLTSVALRQMAEIAREVYHDQHWEEEAVKLKKEIDGGISRFGIVTDHKHGRVYAYEVDGLGKHLTADDANVPSLLSIPYLNYTEADQEVYQNTLNLIWSTDNPWFYTGRFAEGIGSPHTGRSMVWHMSLIMKGIISSSPTERASLIRTILSTDAGTELMHESFNPSDPNRFTRHWFAWANSLFGYWLARMAENGDVPML